MTQLTFEFTTTGYPVSGTPYRPNRVASKTPVVQPSVRSANSAPAGRTPTVRTPAVRTGQSLSLYEDGRKDLHHIGDLAQAVLDRYEIVHRRRAARLARERAAAKGE